MSRDGRGTKVYCDKSIMTDELHPISHFQAIERLPFLC